MKKVSMREARERLSHLLDSVALGQDVVIVRRGKPAARLTAVRKSVWRGVPDHSALRRSLSSSGRGGTETVRPLRDGERF